MSHELRVLQLIIAAFTLVESFPAIGAASTRRIMLLHGSQTSASSFLNSPSRFGAKDFIAGVPAEGVWSTNELWNKPGMRQAVWNWHISALDAEGPDGNWYASDLKGLDASIERVEEAIEQREVTGIIGFEQGGLVAALVAARAALGESSCKRLRTAIVCSAAMPAEGSQYADLLSKLRDGKGASVVPTLHCLSKADSVSPWESGQELAGCFGPAAEVMWHDLGHAVPSRMWWRDSDAFLERAWQAKWSNGRRSM